MKSTVTHATVAAQPGWFLAIFTDSNDVRYEQIIAWEIQRMTSRNGLVCRFPIPITAESKNMDLDCDIWGVKRPDGKFVFPAGANGGISKTRLTMFARLVEKASLIEQPVLVDKPAVASPRWTYSDEVRASLKCRFSNDETRASL